LRTRKRQDTEGRDRYSTEVIVDNFIFLDSKGAGAEWEEDFVEPMPEDMVAPEDEEVPF
jgi:single-stranded DNA-binding protein